MLGTVGGIYSRFNPRICKRCDPRNNPFLLNGKSFNPRICKRCDNIIIRPKLTSLVSIHASVKDATFYTNHVVKHKVVSIHASVKDATW